MPVLETHFSGGSVYRSDYLLNPRLNIFLEVEHRPRAKPVQVRYHPGSGLQPGAKPGSEPDSETVPRVWFFFNSFFLGQRTRTELPVYNQTWIINADPDFGSVPKRLYKEGPKLLYSTSLSRLILVFFPVRDKHRTHTGRSHLARYLGLL